MNRKYRKTIIAGNWKMFKTASETRAFAEELKSSLPRAKRCSIALCVPYVDIPAASKILKDSRISVGAQNVHWANEGTFTGEISADMLADLDVKYVIVGHSERRQLFLETDLVVNRKVHAALGAGLNPIICVGEDWEQRQLGVTLELISYQLKTALAGVTPEQMRHVVIAYEPVWAIGTGMTATAQDANRTIAAIRGAIREVFGYAADDVRILYGGSMNDKNAGELMSQPEIDGGLIGGASLIAEKFEKVINYHG